MTLQEQFGQIDIYLFDQLLRGRIRPGQRILDAGCGGGRNLVYFLREGYDVYGVDVDQKATGGLPPDRFRVEPVDRLSFDDSFFDVVICNTVLHFARDDEDFEAMLQSLWRVMKPGGMLFTRLGSSIGIENQLRHIEGRHYASPDGSDRYLVNEALLMQMTEALGGELLDPIKTTVVQNLRSMTTWVLRKPAPTSRR
jgi:2-polyprenyl-3-methyl-5-hydroxy-6-metoxy-1,4-benzoquinol methylase